MDQFFHRDAVFKRLIDNAANIWGLPESELEAIDPLAKLLIGGLAKEIERIGHEIHNSDQRIFRKQAQFLLPEVEQCAQPAHTVIQLFPEETSQLSPYEAFTFERTLPSRGPSAQLETEEITFTTPGRFSFSPAHITHCIHQDEAYRCKGLDRTPLGAIQASGNPQVLAVRMAGWTPDCGTTSALYFSWINEPDRRSLYRKMSGVRAYYQGQEIPIHSGIGTQSDSKPLPDHFSEKKRLEEGVLHRYDERFLRIELPENTWSEDRTTSDLEGKLRQFDPQTEGEGLWIDLHFPPEVSVNQLQNLRVLDNCVPVMNRLLNSRILDLRKDLNLKQIQCKDHFIEIDRVESSRGEIYKEVPSIHMNQMSKGAYHLRMGGVGRTDERDGAQHLQYMLELLRSEHSAFTALELTSALDDLEDMEQILNRMSARLGNMSQSGRQPFIVIKPLRSRETVHIHFWSTKGQQANDIPLLAEMRTRNPGLSQSGKVKVVSEVLGGNHEVDDPTLITKYRHALLSHGAIVTKEDIRGLCASICGADLLDVQVDMGIVQHLSSRDGLSRCIDIRLMLRPVSDQQQQLWISEIDQELDARSNLNLPIRIEALLDESD